MTTEQTEDVREMFTVFFERVSVVRDQRLGIDVHVGGNAKFVAISKGFSLIDPSKNKTVNALLVKLAEAFQGYYASLDHASFRRLYIPRESSASGDDDDNDVPLSDDGNENVESSPKKVAEITHDAIISILRQRGESVDHVRIQWSRKSDLARENVDFFRTASIGPSKDNAFSFTLESHDSGPVHKKRKCNGGSVAFKGRVEEDATEPGGEHSRLEDVSHS